MKSYQFFRLSAGKLENKFRIYVSSKLKIDISKPQVIYYLMNNTCNYRCIFCDHWKMGQNDKIEKHLPIETVRNIIDQAASWKIMNFGISGGEPLLFKDKLFEILEYANRKGLYTHFGSNGKLLTKEIFETYDKIGGGHISFSMDGSTPKTCDKLRGVKGVFTNSLRVLDAFASVQPKNIVLKINTIITNENLEEVIDIIGFAKKIKACIFLQPYDPYNWHNRNDITWDEYSKNFPLWVKRENLPVLEKVIRKLIKIKRNEPSLVLNPKTYLLDLQSYFSRKMKRNNCIIGYHSMVILPHGEINLCRFGHIASIADEQDIKKIWKSSKYEKIRYIAKDCNYNCMLGCMYDPDILDWMKIGLDFLKKQLQYTLYKPDQET
jgi:MoaA/NifB/PqqE/SkfB family radical SAM enzyme